MSRVIRLLPLLLLLLAVGREAAAQPAAIQPCAGVPVTDSGNVVARALEAQYARIAAAVRAEDENALASLYSPQLVVRMPNGQTWGFEQSLAYSRAGFAQVDSTILTSNRIVALRVCGARATATVLQQWSRMQRVAGVVRRRDTAAVQDETWISTPDGWKRALIEHIVMGVALVDGKPVDPTRPYDPAAPPYDPYAPARPPR